MAPFGFADTFEVSPDPWAQSAPPASTYTPDFANDEALKVAFGTELGRGIAPFDAGLIVFNQELPKALWVSANWLNDPVVNAAKDAYLKTLSKAQKPLDKEELLAKILAFHDEKDAYGRPLVEAKERLNALKLYSDVSGFTGKVDIDASTNTINNTNNLMKITLVKGSDNKAPKVIDAAPNSNSEIPNLEPTPIKLKLVSGSR